jgi:hypothetical protein
MFNIEYLKTRRYYSKTITGLIRYTALPPSVFAAVRGKFSVRVFLF